VYSLGMIRIICLFLYINKEINSLMKKYLSVKYILLISIIIAQSAFTSYAQTSAAVLCDTIEGICATQPTPQQKKSLPGAKQNINKPIKIVYYTDPICSSCWGIEPQLKKLKLEYGHLIEFEYRMGGLLPSWNNFNSGGITKPSDVAHHWDEVSGYYQMPIDGDIWLEDPLSSSYPPSIAFKAAQLQDEEKALIFMRKMREMVFLEKKNIARWNVIEQAAKAAGLEINKMRKDFENAAKKAFEQDLALAKTNNVRGFPTLFFTRGKEQVIVYGAKPYDNFEQAVKRLLPNAEKKKYLDKVMEPFLLFPSLTAKEYSLLTGLSFVESVAFLDAKLMEGKLVAFSTKNGKLYRAQ
jgi:putative protein-disulfide isomerase